MASADTLDVTTDVVIPCLIIVALIVLNAFIFAFIMRKRRQVEYDNVNLMAGSVERKPEVPCTSADAVAALAPRATAEQTDDEEHCTIEMVQVERL